MLLQPKQRQTQQVKRCLGLGSFDSDGGSILKSDMSGMPLGCLPEAAIAAAIAAKLKSGPSEGIGGMPWPGI